MRMLRIEYTGSNKVIKALCEAVNHLIDKDYETNEAYAHAQLTSGNPHHVTAEELGLGTIQDQINAIMEALGTKGDWQSKDGDYITDHQGERIQFHTVARILEYH